MYPGLVDHGGPGFSCIMKKFLLSFLFILVSWPALLAALPEDWAALHADVNFYMVNDMGRNGYFDQQPIAEIMGEMVDYVEPECIFAVGDVHHFWGVASVNDPLWMTNYELIYKHPNLMMPWFPVLGNHEYRGNTQAVLDYARVSRRWMMPSRYYTKILTSGEVSVRVVMIDTSPLIERYRKGVEKYPDACKQSVEAQMEWLDAQLAEAAEDWVIVMGHHPIYAYTDKTDSERADMQRLVDPILRNHRVDVYACGHIHNFQHIRMPDSDIDYIVNSAGALSREPEAVEGTRFCSGKTGFSVVSATKTSLDFHFVDAQGEVIYTVHREK